VEVMWVNTAPLPSIGGAPQGALLHQGEGALRQSRYLVESAVRLKDLETFSVERLVVLQRDLQLKRLSSIRVS
jgi:hypothetical protein